MEPFSGVVRPMTFMERLRGLGLAAALRPPPAPGEAERFQAYDDIDEGEHQRAFPTLRAAAAAGVPDAMAELAIMWDFGNGLPVDKPRAARLYHMAADRDHARSAFDLGCAYAEGDGVELSGERAIHFYVKAGKLGDVRGLNNLGRAYMDGELVAPDYAYARRCFEVAIDAGHAKAMRNLADMLDAGMGCDADKDAAWALYEQAAEAGDEGAEEVLLRKRYMGVAPGGDPASARSQLLADAAAGEFDAMFILAERYGAGVTFQQDLVASYELAALAVGRHLDARPARIEQASALMGAVVLVQGDEARAAARARVAEKAEPEDLARLARAFDKIAEENGFGKDEADAWRRLSEAKALNRI